MTPFPWDSIISKYPARKHLSRIKMLALDSSKLSMHRQLHISLQFSFNPDQPQSFSSIYREVRTSEWQQAVCKYKWPKIENISSSHRLDALLNSCLLGLQHSKSDFAWLTEEFVFQTWHQEYRGTHKFKVLVNASWKPSSQEKWRNCKTEIYWPKPEITGVRQLQHDTLK